MISSNKNMAACRRIAACRRVDGLRVGRSQANRIDVEARGVPSICAYTAERGPTVTSIGGLPHVEGAIQNSIAVTRIYDEWRIEVLVI